MRRSCEVPNLLDKELMLRWPTANLFKFFNFKWCRILSEQSPKFRLLYCSLNCKFWETDVSASFEYSVTDWAKFVAWKLSTNSHKPPILLIQFMTSLPDPFLMRCKYFLPIHSLRYQICEIQMIQSFQPYKTLCHYQFCNNVGNYYFGL